MQEVFSFPEELSNVSVFPWISNRFKLWNLLEMLKISAEKYIQIGQFFREISRILKQTGDEDKPLTGDDLIFLMDFLSKLKGVCNELKLTLAPPMLDNYIRSCQRECNNVPKMGMKSVPPW